MAAKERTRRLMTCPQIFRPGGTGIGRTRESIPGCYPRSLEGALKISSAKQAVMMASAMYIVK